MSRYDATEQDAIRRDNRAMEAASISMVDELDEIFTAINDAAIGITASAADIDALALDAYFFGQDTNTTTGLTFGYKAGRFHNGSAIVTVAAGTLALSASNTNYVEVDRAGTVSSNTSGFTAGQFPLYVVVCGISSITSVTNRKCPYTLVGTGGITGALMSTASKTTVLEIDLGTVSATGSPSAIIAPSFASKLTRASVIVDTTLAANDTDYWTFTLVNKTSSGAGSTAMLAASDANTTKATGGAGFTNYVERQLTLHGTAANLDVAANDGLLFTATKSGSAANLSKGRLKLEFTHEG